MVNFEKKFYESSHFHFYIEELNEKNIPIKYIVMETCEGIQGKDSLKVYVVIALIISAVFVGFIGYFF